MILVIAVALFAHWVADFPVQAFGHRWMGRKATSLRHLATHVYAYYVAFSLTWMLAMWAIVGFDGAFGDAVGWWIVLNSVLHGAIDFVTSKATKRCWESSGIGQIEFTGGTDLAEPGKTCSTHVSLKPVQQKWVGAFFSTIGFDQFLHVAILIGTGIHMGALR
jgi:hypothetical protein